MGEETGSPVSHSSYGCTYLLVGEGWNLHVSSLLPTSLMEGTKANLYHSNLEGGHQSDIPLGVSWVYNPGTFIYPKANLL